jgi:phosphoribosyl 1,2-cyclic phosphate phosphodiesterase
LNWLLKVPIDIYGDAPTIKRITTGFEYIFKAKPEVERYYKPALVPHIISGTLDFDGVRIIPFIQDHTYSTTLGFRIGNFAYSTDAKSLDDAAFEALKGVEVWIVDCVSYNEHPTHSHFDQTLEWIARVQPRMAHLTHMGTSMDYNTLCGQLPDHVRPAYDGLKINL